MGEQFYTILTSIGKAKIANSNVLGTKLNLTKFQVGDGGGSYYNPTEGQTQLKNKVWEGNINSIRVDTDNPNWIVIEVVIPSNQGGFMIREAGVIDDEGNLIAIGKYPETFKPHIDNGSSKDLFIRMILEISNTQNVTLKVDPTVIMATKRDIEILDNRLSKLEKEILDNNLEVLKTDVLMTPLVGCSGGFVNVDSVQGKTDVINGKLASVGEPIGVGNNLYTLPTTKTYTTTSNTMTEFYFSVKAKGTFNYVIFTSYSAISTSSPKFIFNSGSNSAWELFVGINGTTGGQDNKEIKEISLKPNTDYIVEFTLVKTNENLYNISNVSIKECQYRIEILTTSNGKNRFDKSSILLDTNMSDIGVYEPIANNVISNYCLVEPNTSYRTTNRNYQSIWFFDEHRKFINKITTTNPNDNFTTPINCRWAVVYLGSNEILNKLDTIMLIKSTDSDSYENYKGDKTEILLKDSIKSIPNGVCDILYSNGIIKRKCAQVSVNDFKNWWIVGSNKTVVNFGVDRADLNQKSQGNGNAFIDKLAMPYSYDNTQDIEHMYFEPTIFVLCLNKSRLGIIDADSDAVKLQKLAAYLNQNNLQLIYELQTPVEENTNKTLVLRGYDNLVVNCGAVQPTVNYSYAKNVGERFVSIENTLEGVVDKVDNLNEYKEFILTPLNGMQVYLNSPNKVIKHGNVCMIIIALDATNMQDHTKYGLPYLMLPEDCKPKSDLGDFYISTSTGISNLIITRDGRICRGDIIPTAKPTWMCGIITYII